VLIVIATYCVLSAVTDGGLEVLFARIAIRAVFMGLAL